MLKNEATKVLYSDVSDLDTLKQFAEDISYRKKSILTFKFIGC